MRMLPFLFTLHLLYLEYHIYFHYHLFSLYRLQICLSWKAHFCLHVSRRIGGGGLYFRMQLRRRKSRHSVVLNAVLSESI